MKIGIAGLGFVGDAVKHGLEHFGYNNIQCYDPYKFPDPIDILEDCDFVFVCVPTPMGGNGEMDATILHDVLSGLEHIKYGGIVIIKSTVTPMAVNSVITKYNLKIITNPEFLTERFAREDFINTKWIYLGGHIDDCNPIKEFYEKIFPNATIDILSAEGAMMVKYMTNVFFAVKVSLMNEFYKVWEALNYNDSWEELANALSHDERVGTQHLKVPGTDGDFGFGGRCFPKDLNALMHIAKQLQRSHNIMKATWEDNKEFRTKKDWLK